MKSTQKNKWESNNQNVKVKAEFKNSQRGFHLLMVLPLLFGAMLSVMGMPAGAQPMKKDRQYYETRGEIVWEVPIDERLVAITFDDGPDPQYTPLILDILQQYQGKSTFFTLGSRIEEFPELAKRIVNEGHEIANHTYSHLYLRQGMSPKKYLAEMIKTQHTIQQITGQASTLFRPPGGYYNDAVVKAATDAGVQVVLWSWHQDTKDWKKPGVDFIVNKVMDNLRNGDIILMHDHVTNQSQTVQALKVICEELSRQGYQFVTVSELLSHHKMFNNKH